MRPTGMRVAEVSVLLLSDPKVVKLRRLGGDAAQLAFIRFILSCWQWGERLSVDDQEPDHAAAIREAGLVDDDGCFRESAWDDWYGVRVRQREAGRKAGLASGEARRTIHERSFNDRSTQTDRQTDSLPARTRGRTVHEGPKRGDGTLMSFREAMALVASTTPKEATE
jgi:hypothetical protein